MTKHKQTKLFSYALVAILPALFASCHPSQNQDGVVTKSYIHRYGVEVPSEEWVEQGQSGQVVEVMQNGVTVTKSYREGLLEGPVSYTFPHRKNVEHVELYANGMLQQIKIFYPSGSLREEREFEDGIDKKCSRFYENGSLASFEVLDGPLLVQGKYYTLDHAIESEVEAGSGKKIERDPFGQLLFVDTIQDGELALRIYQHPNGMPKACQPYLNGQIHGVVRTYMPGGDPQTIEQWVAGEQHGRTSFYLDGEYVGEVNYEHGKRVGIERRFADNGQRLVEETSWVNGERHGPSYTYLQGQRVEHWFFRGKEMSKVAFDHMSSSLH